MSAIPTLLAVLLLCVWWRMCGAGRRRLPGPRGLPLLGCLRLYFSSFSSRWRYFTQMSAQYGDLFACTLPGGRQWLVACSAHALRETISGPNEDAFSGRPDFDAEMLGITQIEGTDWRKARLVLGQMINHMEHRIMDFLGLYIAEFVADLETLTLSRPNSEVEYREIGRRISRLTSSCMLELIFGPQWRELISREEHDYIIEANYNRPKHVISIDFLMQRTYKWLRHIPERWLGRERQLHKVQQDNSIVQLIYRRAFEQVLTKRQKGLHDGMPTDKSFLDMLPNNSDQNDSFYNQLAVLVDDLLIPMSNSPMHTLCWSLLFLAEKSHIQKRVQSELDAAIGLPFGTNLPIQTIIEKRSILTYSMATFWEVLRFGSSIVTTFARRVSEPVVVRGCQVPADSLLSINFWAINRDPTQWDKPAEFWPEHFYGENEEGVPCVKNLDRLVPFSTGPRACPMRGFVTKLLQTLFCAVFHRFTARPGALWPSIADANIAVNREPPPFTMSLNVRVHQTTNAYK